METNDSLVKIIERDCPFCNKVHEIEIRKCTAKLIVKDEIVEYEKIYYYCPFTTEEENQFVPAGIMDVNLSRAREAYRIKKLPMNLV